MQIVAQMNTKSDLAEIKVDTTNQLATKSCSLNALNDSFSYSLSPSSSPPTACSPDSVTAKLNGLLMLSKKSSTNSLKQGLSRNSSMETIDTNLLSIISSSSVILTPSPSPTPGNLGS